MEDDEEYELDLTGDGVVVPDHGEDEVSFVDESRRIYDMETGQKALKILRGTVRFYDKQSNRIPAVESYGYFFDSLDDVVYLLKCVQRKVNPNAPFVARTFGKLAEYDRYRYDDSVFRPKNSNIWWKYFFSCRADCKIYDGEIPNFRSDYKTDGITGGKGMSNMNETMQMVLSMKMLKGLFSDGKDKELDVGKLMLMQQMMGGQKLKVSDVVKAKLMTKFSLDKTEDLSIEKAMLLQMLDGGEVDVSQLISIKMLGEMLSEEKK